VLRLRFSDFSRATRSVTLPRPTADTGAVLEAARSLVAASHPLIQERGLTLVGIAVANLDNGGAVQLELPLDGRAPGALDEALDEARARFGRDAVVRGTLVGRRLGWEMPRLAD
jgi:DNA polymerase-4